MIAARAGSRARAARTRIRPRVFPPRSLTRRAFGSPRGIAGAAEMNLPKAWRAGFPAFGGVGSARGLAKIAALANGGRLDDADGSGEPVILPR
ncbi:MAG: hypothetical protein R3F11_19925 [Verrucomicrobiales bacterium]